MSSADAALRRQLATLYEMQEHDMGVSSIRKQLQDIPRQIERLDASVAKASKAIAATAAALAEVEKAQRSKNAALQTNAVQREKYETEQRTATSNEAYSALERQIEYLNQQDADLEDEILMLMEEADRLKAELTAMEAEVAEENERHAERKAALQNEARDLEQLQVERRQARDALLPEIDKRIIEEYLRWRQRQRMPFLALGLKGTCGSCRISIQPQTLKEAQKYQKLVYCSSCKRALYVQSPSSDGPFP